MKKFDDILRVISSVLLGALVKDFDQLSGGLEKFFANHPRNSGYAGWVAMMTSLVLVAVFIRNIHASARYDDLAERTSYVPGLERTVGGRFIAFVLAIAGLFVAPVAAHLLAFHLSPDTPLGFVFIALFLPFLVYVIWDVALWLLDQDQPSEPNSVRMSEVSHRWLIIDGLCIIGVFLAALIYLLYGAEARSIPPEAIAVLFIIVATLTIAFDYYHNRHFYFPASTDDTAQQVEQRTLQEQNEALTAPRENVGTLNDLRQISNQPLPLEQNIMEAIARVEAASVQLSETLKEQSRQFEERFVLLNEKIEGRNHDISEHAKQRSSIT